VELIQLATKIAAPPERCFLLSLSIDLHMQSTAHTSERAVAGVTSSIIGPGERVTWQGRHFGFMLTHETLISKYERPNHFQDIMLRGVFRSFEHDHYFDMLEDSTTLMRDELRFVAPLGPLGRMAEVLFLRTYLSRFLAKRNELIREVAEGDPQIYQALLKI